MNVPIATQIRCEGEWSSYSRTVSVLTADQDVERQQCGTFTFVGHEMGEGAIIFVELLSGSDAEKFNEYLNAKGNTSEKHQRLDGDIDPPIATAPPLTESEAELRYSHYAPP